MLLNKRYLTIINCYLLFVLMLFSSNAMMANEPLLEYPEIGILSTDYLANLRAKTELSYSKTSRYVSNWQNDGCKLYVEKSRLEQLKSILIFEDKDIEFLTSETKKNYDENSEYFETCNYFYRSSWIQTLFHWSEGNFVLEKDELLEWKKTDAIVEGDHGLLLIDFIEDDVETFSDSSEVKALYIYKKIQFISNRGKPFWK